MARVILYGWKTGLDRMDLTELLQLRCRLPREQASGLVDSLLDARKVELAFADQQEADDFASAATDLGALCNVENR
jgi:hypothetical protein